MARHAYLAELFDHYGLDVIEYPGWKTRGSDRFAGNGDVWHSTVTPPSMPDRRAADLLANGYAGLNGPLSQRGTARSGAVHVIAAGRCSHNGYGFGGNDWFGNEVFNDGYGEPFTAEQMRSSLIQSAALAAYRRWAVTQVLGHKETDPRRKIDPRTVWMPGVRRDVQYLLDTGISTGEFRMDDEARLRIAALDQRMDRLEEKTGDIYEALIGTYEPAKGDENPAARSVATLVRGLAAETISGSASNPNSRKSILRRIFDNHRVPAEPAEPVT